MKVSTDKKLDIGYVQLRRGKVYRTLKVRTGILLDLDRSGRVVGIELLSLSKLAPNLRVKNQRRAA